jgi:hypothetical protein
MYIHRGLSRTKIPGKRGKLPYLPNEMTTSKWIARRFNVQTAPMEMFARRIEKVGHPRPTFLVEVL